MNFALICPDGGTHTAPVPGLGERYAVTDDGRVIALLPSTRFPAGHVLRPHRNNSGYLVAVLWDAKERRYHSKTVHRLVAEGFLQRPPDCGEVNHKDGDKLNNRVSNLEWTTRRQNWHHALRNGFYESRLKKLRRPVIGVPLGGGEALRFIAITHVKRAEFTPWRVRLCCVGRKASHKGYVWQYGDGGTT